MLSIILGAAGLAGGGGIAALVAKFGAKAVLGGTGDFFKGVPRWVWIALAVIAALVALIIWHQAKAHAAIAAAKGQQKTLDDAAWQAAFAKERQAAQLWQRSASARLATISNQQRNLNDETNRRIVADAGDLLLRGPGKAAAAGCRPVGAAGLPAAPGRPQSTSAAPDDAGTILPGDDGAADRAVVSWRWLVGRAGQCDAAIAENVSWRTDYQERAKSWEQLRAAPRGSVQP